MVDYRLDFVSANIAGDRRFGQLSQEKIARNAFFSNNSEHSAYFNFFLNHSVLKVVVIIIQQRQKVNLTD